MLCDGWHLSVCLSLRPSLRLSVSKITHKGMTARCVSHNMWANELLSRGLHFLTVSLVFPCGFNYAQVTFYNILLCKNKK